MRPSLIALLNVAKAWLLLGGFVALLSALGWVLGGLRLGSLFFVVTLLMAATLFWYGPRIVLASLGARELLLAEAPQLWSAAERLAIAARVERPKLYVLPDGHPRALAVGRGASASGLAVSTGLATLLPPAELEGVLAHELARVRHRDVVIETPLVVVAGWLVEASRIGGFLERALLGVLGPVAASFVAVFLSPRRVHAADRLAAQVCETAARTRRRARPARGGAGARALQGQPGHGAALRPRPVRRRGTRRALQDAPGRGRARRASARPRPGVARAPTGGVGARRAAACSRRRRRSPSRGAP